MSRRAYGKFRKVINIRIGEDDFYRAAKCASAQGVSVSEYCRQLVRGAVVMGEKLQGTGFEEKVIEGFRELFGEELKKAFVDIFQLFLIYFQKRGLTSVNLPYKVDRYKRKIR